jgi:hypothetical protein
MLDAEIVIAWPSGLIADCIHRLEVSYSELFSVCMPEHGPARTLTTSAEDYLQKE